MSGVTNLRSVARPAGAEGGSATAASDTLDSIKERLRGDGIQTVSKLLQETRAENKILKDRNNQLERTVDSLNNRLIKNNSDRGGGVGENCVSHTSSTAAQSHLSQPDEELSTPVTSRQLVENLVKENAKLKQHIQNPRKIDELIQKNFSLQSYNRQLAIDKTRVEEELTRLQNLLHLSDKDKDKELVDISSKLESYKEQWQREKSLREALENQIQKLNNELADTAQACLAMRKQLPSSTTQQLERPSSPAQVLSTQPAVAAKLSTEPSTQEDNMRLQARCRELTLRLERHDAPDSQSYRRLDQLEDENRHLKSIIAERDREVKDLRDKCHLLEHQLKAYKDDFLKEREDRELMHQKLSSIEGKYQQLKDQTPQRQLIGNTGNNAWDSRQQSTKQKPSSQMTAKVPTVKEGKAQQWTAKSSSRAQARTAEDNVSLSSQTEVVRPANPPGLACYKCGKKFKREHHSDLIDHLDVCPS